MAGTSRLAPIRDIAGILDDMWTMTKVAAKTTSGVPGGDLALNAQQGMCADCELPVAWAVAQGSLRDKLPAVPAALAISALASWPPHPP